MSFVHVPVMCEDAVAALNVTPGGCYVDATFGGGGYTRAILSTSRTVVYAFDRDEVAITNGAALLAQYKDRLILIHAPFSAMKEELLARSVQSVDGVVFDLGVSSPQLDDASRGFSFSMDGPLDMRMDRTTGRTAADIVNTESEQTLALIFKDYGEERRARALARAVVRVRAEKPFERTSELARLVRSVVKKTSREAADPATRSFQALRIAVNAELEELKTALAQTIDLLKPGGRVAVVSFHSLEDRIVKTTLTQRAKPARTPSRYQPSVDENFVPYLSLLTTKPLVPSAEEVKKNPRARSAKLRVAERRKS